MRHFLAAVLVALLLSTVLVGLPPTAFSALGQEKVIDVRASRPPTGDSFDGLWAVYRNADQAGDAETSSKAFREIRRLRIERNIRSLDEIGLALAARGLERLGRGEREKAEEDFHSASGVDPQLPDAYFGLALLDLRKGPLGIFRGFRDVVSGMIAGLSTSRGRYYGLLLSTSAALLALLVSASVVSIALVLRHGTLLRHDLEEAFGANHRAMAMSVYAFLLLLPVVTFQGWAWLPLWWLGLLFVYLGWAERLISLVLVMAAVAASPAVKALEARILAEQNPLFRASVLAVEGGPDNMALAALEGAYADARYRDDRDIAYLVAILYKKAGRYDDAASIYRDVLKASPEDSIALNNLANLEFARGEFQAAIARYKQGTQSTGPREVTATFFYNLYNAHLQKFEYEAAQEARSQAERLAPGVVREYDALWKYDKGDYAVADLGLTTKEVWGKFSGAREGVGQKNLAGRPIPALDPRPLAEAALNRFTAFSGVFLVTAFAVSRWRGKKMFTLRCQKCGTPFCRLCHLGAAAGGLCTQCYHLFVVRDGVSGPARNQKLLEVQREDKRRERIFRVLSLFSPGAGHLYAQKTVAGILLLLVWYGIVSVALLAALLVPVTDASAAGARPWGLGLVALSLLVLYVLANRARPDFEVVLPMRLGGAPRRGRAA